LSSGWFRPMPGTLGASLLAKASSLNHRFPLSCDAPRCMQFWTLCVRSLMCTAQIC
ncbi:hypothetical protein PSA5_29135, partial [Pseudomonas syringae pv. actinidiae]